METLVKNHLGLLQEQGETGRQDRGWMYSLTQDGPDAESLASLYPGAKSNLRDRVLGEVEKSSLMAFPGKGDTAG